MGHDRVRQRGRDAPGAIENTDFSSHALEQTELPATDYLVHLNGLIAFLEVYEKEGGGGGSGVLNLVPRQQG